jgi:hypothetical protein
LDFEIEGFEEDTIKNANSANSKPLNELNLLRSRIISKNTYPSGYHYNNDIDN